MKVIDLEIAAPSTSRSQDGNAVAAADGPVLVAIDFSPESEAALVWASEYAGRIGAPLEVVHVIHDPADSPGRYKPENNDPLEPMVEVAQRKLADFLDRVSDNNPDRMGLGDLRTICRPGLPASTIVQVAQAHGVRHLVLGGRRRNALTRLLHGSTAQQVAGLAKLPVTIVKAAAS